MNEHKVGICLNLWECPLVSVDTGVGTGNGIKIFKKHDNS